MSLKAIHICFVTLFTLLCFGLATYMGRTWMQEGGRMNLCLSVVGGVTGVLMVFYFRLILRKLKDVSML